MKLKTKNLLINWNEFFCLHGNIEESIGIYSIEKSFLPSCFEIRREGFLWIQQKKMKGGQKPSLQYKPIIYQHCPACILLI